MNVGLVVTVASGQVILNITKSLYRRKIMKRIIFIITTIILLISMTFPTTVFAASIPTTTITSVKAQSKAFTVKWKKKSSITGYQIQYSTDSKFKKGKKSIKTKNAKTVSKKITKLKAAKKYYVRIRTYKVVKKKISYSSWSKKKCVTIKSAEPITAATTTQKYCTNNNNHSMSCGNMEKWFNNKNEIEQYLKEIDNSYAEKYENGEITYKEYVTKVPYGYECWSCSYCGKWTGNFFYR